MTCYQRADQGVVVREREKELSETLRVRFATGDLAPLPLGSLARTQRSHYFENLEWMFSCGVDGQNRGEQPIIPFLEGYQFNS